VTTPALIAPQDFWAPFENFSYSVFRLETLQSYAGSGEDQELAAFAAGMPRPPAPSKSRWTGMLTANHHAGKIQQRVHVIAEPLTDYMRYELTWAYEPNADAGEDIRIIPVAEGQWPFDLPRLDFWLFDSSVLYAMVYEPDGTWLGAEPVSDPERVVQACHWRDAALYHSTPWREYIASRPDLRRYLAQ
jgi:Family of unknown function (DUF6879)